MIFDMMDDPTVRDALLREREDPMSGLSKLASQHWIELYTVTCEMAAVLSRFPDRQETVLRFLLGQGTGHAKLPVQPDELTNLETEIRVLEDKIARAVDAVNMADAWARASQLVRTTTRRRLSCSSKAQFKKREVCTVMSAHVFAGAVTTGRVVMRLLIFLGKSPRKKSLSQSPRKKSQSQSPRKRQRRKKRRRKRPRRKRRRRKRATKKKATKKKATKKKATKKKATKKKATKKKATKKKATKKKATKKRGK